MLFFLGLLLTQSYANEKKTCLRNSLMDVGTCAFDSCSAYTDIKVLEAQLAQCQSGGSGGGGGGDGSMGRQVVMVHRPEDESGKTSFMFGTVTPEVAFEDLRSSTTEAYGHDSEHTYDFQAKGVQVTDDMTMDFSVTDNESLANFLTTMNKLGQVGVLVAEKVTMAPTMSPTEQPTEPILPNVEFPRRTKFWSHTGIMNYEDGVGTWTNRNSYIPVQDCEGPVRGGSHGSYEGDCSLKFTEAWGRMFSQNLDTNAYPFYCTAYWIAPEATSINMLVNVSGVGWRSIKWTWDHFDTVGVSYALIGEFGVKADGNWNYECMNLSEITGGRTIHEMIFHWPANYDYPHPPAGDERTEFWLDSTSLSDEMPTIEHRGEFYNINTNMPTVAPTVPVVPLAVWSEGTQFLKINDYEDGVDGWTNRNSFIPVQDCEFTPKYQGDCVLKFNQGYAWGRMLSSGWNTATYPWFCTGYRIPAANDGINMLINISGVGWRSIEWTWSYFDDVGISYPWVGKFEGLVNDGKWRHGCFNAAEMTGDRNVAETIFHWPANHKYPYPWGNVGGSDDRTFYLDDTTISSEEPTEYLGPEVGQ